MSKKQDSDLAPKNKQTAATAASLEREHRQFHVPSSPVPNCSATAGELVHTPSSLSQNNAALHTPRKLHLGHFAFIRALVEGLDTRDSWDRYLRIEGEHSDVRTVRKTIAWIRDAFAAAARRHHRFGIARLVLVDIAQLGEAPQSLPGLEDFAAGEGIEAFSQQEQLARYEIVFGKAAVRRSQRSRMLVKQLQALRWLEALVAQMPVASDPVASWLNPDLAGHLQASGLLTLQALIERINGIGRRWWVSIPAVGAIKAGRILEWLIGHQTSLEIKVGLHVGVPRRKLSAHELESVVPKATAIVPLHKLIVPSELDGSTGRFRAPREHCMMRADTDYDALLLWIRTRHGLSADQKRTKQLRKGVTPEGIEGPMDWLEYLSHTQRAYLKEAERFLLWAIVQHRTPLSSMTMEDCEQYRQFLTDPSPHDRWCAPRGRQKWSVLWRPFEGPLSKSAQAHALRVLKSFYTFLVDQCYLVGNPWNGVAVPKANRVAINRGRSFTQEQWHFITQQAASLVACSSTRRLRFVLHLYYATGLRLVEGVQAQLNDLRWVSYASLDSELVEGWELTVLGKGNKERIVPVPQDIVAELSQYLVSRGLDPDPRHTANSNAYLIGQISDATERAPWSPLAQRPVNPKAGIATGTLYDQLKAFFIHCAKALAVADAKGAERLRAGSTHWLRHTHGTHAVAAGVPLDIVQQNMGHASLDTTTGYTTSEERRRMLASQKFWRQ